MPADITEPRNETEVARRAAEILRSRLPPGWTMQFENEPRPGAAKRSRSDGLITITSPDGQKGTLVIEAKRVVAGRDVTYVRDQFRDMASNDPDTVGILVAKYLSPPVRARLVDAEISYIDLTENISVSMASPGLCIRDRGADSDPWRGPGRPRGSLKGKPAAKVVRTLVDIKRAWSMRELIETSGVSTGAAYRVVKFLEQEELVARDAKGVVSVINWPLMLRRWSEDYGFVSNNRISRWIAPRGLPNLLERMATGSDDTYAVTGTIAAANWAEYAPARSAMIYVASREEVAKSWGLSPTEAGANVILAEPENDVAFDRTIEKNGVVFAGPSQVVVDLMTGPGRSPSEAEELLRWMQANERVWRR